MEKLEDLLRGELIGMQVSVADSKNSSNKKIKGKIIDETKNIFTIKTKDGRKKIIKNQNKIEFDLKNKKMTVDGKLLVGRPEDRIKTAIKWIKKIKK